MTTVTLEAPADVLRPMRRVASGARRTASVASRFPVWMRIADQVHGCGRSAATLGADAGVLIGAGQLAGISRAVGVALALAMLAAFNVGRVYRPRTTLEVQGIMWYPPRIVTPLAVVTLAIVAFDGRLGISQGEAIEVALLGAAGLVLLRTATWIVLSAGRRSGIGLRRTVIVGSGELARLVVQKLRGYPEVGLEPAGILAPDGWADMGDGIGFGALPADLPEMIRHGRVSHVILVPEGNSDNGIMTCLELCDGLDAQFSMLPPLADLFLHPGLVAQVGGLPLLSLGKVARSRPALPGKRVLDAVGAGLLLLILSPLMLATAIAIKLCDRGPVFYRQSRVGQGGVLFGMLKFRSMVVDADRMLIDLRDQNITDGLLFKMRDDPRVTRVGRIIRRLSIDELPQLWNVLRGEMSLVGPRPLPVDPADFGALDGKRHSVPPGITGYWQTAGGTGLSYQEMVKLDLAYIQNWSLWLDLRLLFRTVPALVTRGRHGAC
jgi:exopolysaccharide biosynthesis polyprenyl glycosylphosphotransferase